MQAHLRAGRSRALTRRARQHLPLGDGAGRPALRRRLRRRCRRRSMSIATCGKRSSSTCCRTPSSSRSTASVAVTLRAARRRARELTVRDTGVGIPAHELPRLFERFHRVEGAARPHARGHRHRPRAGAGAGQAAWRHGRASRARSAAARTFTVSHPARARRICRPTASAPRAARAVDRRSAPRPSSRRRCAGCRAASGAAELGIEKELIGPAAMPAARERSVVLLADDNADMRDYVRRLLARALRRRGGRRWRGGAGGGAARGGPTSC